MQWSLDLIQNSAMDALFENLLLVLYSAFSYKFFKNYKPLKAKIDPKKVDKAPKG